jgi:hypothetical protein
MADGSVAKMEKAKNCLQKIEKTKKCLAVLAMLRQHIAELKALNLSGLEIQYADSSFVHTNRIQNCLNNLFLDLQDSLDDKDQNRGARKKNSRSVKP